MQKHPHVQTEVHDEDPTTSGGPPGWVAFATVAVAFLVVAALVMTLLAIFS